MCWVVNMSGFWIFQHREYTRFLNSQGYIGFTWYPLPHEDGGFVFQGQWGGGGGGLPFYIDNGGPLHMGESQLGISLGGLRYQFLAQSATSRPKSVKVNLINCHREVCRINFDPIVTSDALASLWLFEKMLFWCVLGHVTCFELLSTLLELQRKLGVFWNGKPSSTQWFYQLSKKFFCCSSVL